MKLDYLDIGEIINTHGVKGELKIEPYTDDITRFEKLQSVLILEKEELKEYKIESVRYHKSFVLLKLSKIDDLNTAEKYKGKFISIKRKDAIDLPEGSYFICELIGCSVYEKEKFLGKVKDVIKTGSNDVYVISRENKKDLLVPILKNVVKNVDIENEKIEVELLEGLDEI